MKKYTLGELDNRALVLSYDTASVIKADGIRLHAAACDGDTAIDDMLARVAAMKANLDSLRSQLTAARSAPARAW